MNLPQWCYDRLPDGLIRTLRKSASGLRSLRSHGSSVERITGSRCGYDEKLSVVVIDRTLTVDYLLRRLLTQNVAYGGPHPVARKKIAESIQSRVTADLTFVRRRRGQAVDDEIRHCWCVPDSVVSVIDLAHAAGDGSRRFGNADNLRRIRKHGLYATISHDPQELSEFVKHAYVPYIKNRFGDLARPHSERTLAREFSNGGLLWVNKDGVRHAGVVFSVSGRVIKSRVAAPVSDPQSAKQLRAVNATKKFMIDYASEQGYETLHLGISRPHLFDGVLLHKKSWGARLVDDPDENTELHVSWPLLSPAISDWLYTTPLVVRDGGGLSALTTLPDVATEDACRRHLSRLWSPGLSRIIVLGAAGQTFGINSMNGTNVSWRAPG